MWYWYIIFKYVITKLSIHVGQHAPAGVINVWFAVHCGNKHDTAEQSGLQNGSDDVKHAFSVQTELPSLLHVQSLQPSKYSPLGHDSQPIHDGSVSHNAGTHVGQHSPSLVTAISPSEHTGNAHLTTLQSGSGIHPGQHLPAFVPTLNPGPHNGKTHDIALQSGLQNGSPFSKHNFFVHAAFPFSSHVQSLHPSLNPFGHVSQPTIYIHIILETFEMYI